MKGNNLSVTSKLSFGLIGNRLDYSFSKNYFTRKFEEENINAAYNNFELKNLDSLSQTIKTNQLSGFNVTIPFKEKIIPLLHSLTENAKKIGAVNCVEINNKNQWIGHNTDAIGFENSLLQLIKKDRPNALIFGAGGASKAVQFVLNKLKISFNIVCRNDYLGTIQYQDITKELLATHKLLINTTPVGTHPNNDDCLDLPFQHIYREHFCFDLVYNPEKTQFLSHAQDNGAKIKNGKEMLEIQAEESWNIWLKSK